MEWTIEQKRAIKYSGGNVLLSAAAGSGKTAVLVERVIDRLTDPENPVSIDSVLALTFTDAAASDMQRKISDALTKALSENPKSEHLKRQRLLLAQAHISTVHSFCMELLKDNIQLCDIPADFSIIDEIENGILLNRAVDEVLNRYYAKIDTLHGFASLTLGYGGTKSDNSLRGTIIKLYKFVKSMPDPSKWLCGAVDMYKSSSVWEEKLCEMAKKQIESAKSNYDCILSLIKNNLSSDHPYVQRITEEEYPAFDLIPNEMHLEEIPAHITRLLAALGKNLPAARGVSEDERKTGEQIKSLRKSAKDGLKAFLSDNMPVSVEEMRVRLEKSYPVVKTLKNIVLAVSRKHKKLKRSGNYLDFNDLEHETLALLSDGHGNPSEIALKLRDKFSEILIDEYQDTSNLQEAIFNMLSPGNNKFMVGDMKQSIYGFRNASPRLFLEKYSQYDPINGEDGTLLRLSRNFRSRQNIVDTVNYIFSKIMSREVGDVTYNADEMLFCGAEYPPARERDDETEIIIADVNDGRGVSRTVEAGIVAARIKKLVCEDGMLVFDRDLQKMRPIEYRDIALLMRGKKRAGEYADAMSALGIPVYTEAGNSFLNTVEVQTVLSFLQIIDNPYQDIPLLAVLRSPMFGFTADELSHIRAPHRSGNFYTALKAASEGGNARAADFIEKLTRLRELSEDTSVDTLIWYILNDFGYYFAAGAMENGSLKQSNLRLLQSHAADFERTRLCGLFNFMNYLETLKTSGADLTPAKELENNAVQIMTFHKSKGLEFPVVILADTFAKFNFDSSASIVWHEEYGIGLDYVDTDRRIRYPSMPKLVVGAQIKREALSEEMRLLYVAMTRAKEKLIIFCGHGGRNKKLSLAVKADDALTESYVKSCMCCRDWILPAVLDDVGDFDEKTEAGKAPKAADGFASSVYVIQNADISNPFSSEVYEDRTDKAVCEFDRVKLEERLAYVYPHTELGKIPAKMSVSEIKRSQMADDDVYVPKLSDIEDITLKRPSAEEGRERGTVTHFVMQHLDINASDTPELVSRQIEKMIDEGMLTREQAQAVDAEAAARFFGSEIGKRLKAADEVRREFKFYIELPAAELYPDAASGGGTILLQGVVDCFFTEGDGIVILDYKTDNVSGERVYRRAEHYRVQLDYYARGLTQILGKPVTGKYLYFLNCDETVEIS